MDAVINETRPVGRPRNDIDDKVLDVTMELLEENGFQELSISKIAQRAGVSRPTVYRRWPSKLEIAIAAVRKLHRDAPEPESEDFFERLVAEVRAFRRAHGNFGIRVVASIIAEENRHPELMEVWRKELVSVRRGRIQAIVQAAIDRGDVRADVRPELVSAVLGGVFYGTYTQGMLHSEDIDREVAEMVLNGLSPRTYR